MRSLIIVRRCSAAFRWKLFESCTLFVLFFMILLQKFLPTPNILARAAQKILNISTIFHNFTKKFSINWRAQRGKFFEYIIDLSGFFFRNSILILNKLARAARKIFNYIIDFSRFSQRTLCVDKIISQPRGILSVDEIGSPGRGILCVHK